MKKIIAVTIGFTLVILLAGLLTMWLWNVALVPAIPALVEIGFWQALGIMLLTSILFKTSNFNKK